MHEQFESASWVLNALCVVVPSVLLSLVILWCLRRWISIHELKKNHEVAGFTFSIVGILYSVILGFTVINVQSGYNEVLQTMHTEAILLADLYQDASFFQPEEMTRLRTSLRNYVDYVTQEELGAPRSKTLSFKTRSLLNDIWKSYYAIDVSSEKVKVWYAESISRLNSFMNARLVRQFNSSQQLGSMMWSLLILGGLITVSFMCFFGLENLRSQMLMTALLVSYLSFMLFLVYSLDHAFRREHGAPPADLQEVRVLMDQWDADKS